MEPPSQSGVDEAPDAHDRDVEAQVILEEARRSLDNQRGDLGGLRQRASGLLGISSLALPLATAVGGGDAAGHWGAIALVAFLLAVSSVGYILWPRLFTFELDAQGTDAKRLKTVDTPHFLRSISDRTSEDDGHTIR